MTILDPGSYYRVFLLKRDNSISFNSVFGGLLQQRCVVPFSGSFFQPMLDIPTNSSSG